MQYWNLSMYATKIIYNFAQNYFSEIILSNNFDIIFATGDRHLHEESSILKAARDNNVKVVLPYLTSYGEYENMLSIRKMKNLRDSRNIYSYYMKNKFSNLNNDI